MSRVNKLSFPENLSSFYFSAQFDDCAHWHFPVWRRMAMDMWHCDTWYGNGAPASVLSANLITKSSPVFSIKTKSLSENNKMLDLASFPPRVHNLLKLFAFIDRKIWSGKLGPTTGIIAIIKSQHWEVLHSNWTSFSLKFLLVGTFFFKFLFKSLFMTGKSFPPLWKEQKNGVSCSLSQLLLKNLQYLDKLI